MARSHRSDQWFSHRFRSRKHRSSSERFRRLRCEALEDRRLLAVIAGPQATLEVADITDDGVDKQFLKVTYTDDVAIDISTIDVEDLQVVGPGTGEGLEAVPVEIGQLEDGTPQKIWYRILAPSGTWTPENNGLYTVSMRGEQVFDTDENPVEAGVLGQFEVAIQPDPPADTIRPEALLEVGNILEGGGEAHPLHVFYSDNVAIDVSSIDSADLAVITGPDGQIVDFDVALVEFGPDGDGTPRTARYRVFAPGGTWDAEDNGVYTVLMRPEQVQDTSGNPVEAGVLGRFEVAIQPDPPADTIRPEAVLEVGNILEGGGEAHPLHVFYSDNVAIDVSSIDSADLAVITGPDGQIVDFDVALVEFGPDGDGTPRTARYRVFAPGGTWDAEDNGVYTVLMRPEQVQDTSGNVVEAGVLGQFEVAIQPDPPADTIRPEAVLEVGNILEGGGEAHPLHVFYSDNVAIDVSSIDSADLAVITGPDGQIVDFDVALVEFGPDGDGTPRTARYRVFAPGGTWDAEDNGVYTVLMRPEQVQDTSGNVVEAGVLGRFEVAIQPDPPVDTIRPEAVLEVGNILEGGGEAHLLHVFYSDNVAIDVSSIDSADLAVITGPDGQIVDFDVALVEFGPDGDGTPRTARYRVFAPGGTWDAEDNGVYTVLMRPEQVQDTSGNVVEAGVLGRFEVAIQPDPPADDLVQIVSGTMENISAVAGRRIHFAVEYSTSDNDNTLAGLGLRMHYDSSMLTFDGLKEVLDNGFIQVQDPVADTENFDADSSTDQYILIAWGDTGSQWPGTELPVELFSTSFTTAENLPIESATAIRFTASSTAPLDGFLGQYHFQADPVEVRIGPSMDFDGNGNTDALSDGLLALRYLFGFRGDSLVDNVVTPSPSASATGAQAMPTSGRTDSGEIALYLDRSQATLLDIDDNGSTDALTDGILMLRYLFGFRGDALVEGAIGNGARRSDAVDVADFLDAFLPMPSQGASNAPQAAPSADLYQAFAVEAATASNSDETSSLTNPAVDGVMGMLGVWDV